MIKKIFSLLVLTLACVYVSAQDGAHGAYSPYSMFGIGDLSQQGTAFNKSMGGVGIATRNNRYINYMNPAAVTARDTLSFMADFGLVQKNTFYAQGDLRSANNVFNIYNFIMSFPLWKSSAFMVGITPFSDVGYDFSHIETDQSIIGNTGNIDYGSYGNGSVYQIFVGAGATFWKKFSVGAEFIYYFGNIDKITKMNYANSSYRSINSGSQLSVRGVTGKLGLQYEHKFDNDYSIIVGGTYRLGTDVKGYAVNYQYATQSSVSDSLKYSVDTLGVEKMRMGDEIALGVSVKYGDKWTAEVNYSRSDWSKSGFDKAPGFSVRGDVDFASTVAESFRAGFEYTPNRNDIRYYLKKCSYRGGVYYDKEYFTVNGKNVNKVGLTLGVTLPVFKLYNGLTLGVDFGQRSSAASNVIRERYVMFNIGFNIHDIWFQKTVYH